MKNCPKTGFAGLEDTAKGKDGSWKANLRFSFHEPSFPYLDALQASEACLRATFFLCGFVMRGIRSDIRCAV